MAESITENSSNGTGRCPLCEGVRNHVLFIRVEKGGRGLAYRKCEDCELISRWPRITLTREEEFERYEQHQNDDDDPRYLSHLGKVSQPLISLLHARDGPIKGLDFGCGKSTALSNLLSPFLMERFDPFYAPDTKVLTQHYDFIMCVEVAEHFAQPRREFHALSAMLSSGGLLAVLTEFYPERLRADWWYLRDITHTSFYSRTTFAWLAEQFRLEILPNTGKAIILKKL